MSLIGLSTAGMDPISTKRPENNARGIIKMGTNATVFSGFWKIALSTSPNPSPARIPVLIILLNLGRVRKFSSPRNLLHVVPPIMVIEIRYQRCDVTAQQRDNNCGDDRTQNPSEKIRSWPKLLLKKLFSEQGVLITKSKCRRLDCAHRNILNYEVKSPTS